MLPRKRNESRATREKTERRNKDFQKIALDLLGAEPVESGPADGATAKIELVGGSGDGQRFDMNVPLPATVGLIGPSTRRGYILAEDYGLRAGDGPIRYYELASAVTLPMSDRCRNAVEREDGSERKPR